MLRWDLWLILCKLHYICRQGEWQISDEIYAYVSGVSVTTLEVSWVFWETTVWAKATCKTYMVEHRAGNESIIEMTSRQDDIVLNIHNKGIHQKCFKWKLECKAEFPLWIMCFAFKQEKHFLKKWSPYVWEKHKTFPAKWERGGQLGKSAAKSQTRTLFLALLPTSNAHLSGH